MAKPNLTDLIEWLKSNPLNRFEIYDVESGNTIEKCVSYEELTPDPETYFLNLKEEKGIDVVQIQKKRKNGSSYIRKGCGLNFAIDTNDNVAASGSQAKPAATQQRSYSNAMNGLGNPGTGSFGLGLPEIMDMRSKADRYEELKAAFDKMERRNEDLEKENRKLENENLKYQLGIDSKPSAVDKLVEGLANNPQALPQIIASIKGGGSNPGLNAPETKPQLSDTKSTVVDMISSPQVKDDHVAASYYVLIEALKGNTEFMNEYEQLLQNHNLIQNGSNHSNNS